ncbi:hypothetical protein CSA56_12230 [candidate division KSB3 bacterium]|uniref:FecR protein domain-containing protein n=1 Tax=candidate division KSB3 bacterium TaxID=2044937 RepID=A0A2G6KCE2_9BACT|nr:MAG: hypothetical protein CSA56_12230 [candidate division KSB3 bacterium]
MGLVCLLLFFGTGLNVSAQKISRVVAVSVGEVNGTAEILSREDAKRQQGQSQVLGTLWKPAAPKTNINVGDHVRTGVDSSLTLHLNDGTVFTLSGDSLMVVEELKSAQASIPRSATFFLEHGTISTKHTTRILGQTSQTIRTENGEVNSRMGEVEVYKPVQKYSKLSTEAPAQRPLLAQEPVSHPNRTFVIHKLGTSVTRAGNVGSIQTSSMVFPETCIDNDGVQFILDTQGVEVELSKLVEKNGFRFKANQPVYVLTVTEDQATGVAIQNFSGDAETDVEGISIADLRENSSLRLGVNSLLTVGIKATDAEVRFSCLDEEPEGLNFQIYGTDGNVMLLRDGSPGGQRLVSRGGLVRSEPEPPVMPTVTPETPEPDITPTDTPTPDATPTPIPRPGGVIPLPPPIDVIPTPVVPSLPVTHTFDPHPDLINTTASSTLNGAGCPQPNTYRIDVFAPFENFLPSISGDGTNNILRSWITDQTGSPRGVIAEGSTNQYITAYNYVPPHQETGTLEYAFCYTPFTDITPYGTVYFRLRVWDSYGNPSNVVRCSGDLATNAITCN